MVVMLRRLRSKSRMLWREKRKRVIVAGIIALLSIIVLLIFIRYGFDWTGFNGYNKVSIAHTISGTSSPTITKTEEYQPGKTLWDWMQLLVVPVVLAIGGYLLNLTLKRSEQEATADNQHEAALQDYIDKLSDLLLREYLSELKPEYEKVRKIALVRTLTVLSRLDSKRKGSVLQFLYESGLIDKDKCIIDLRGANLSRATLRFANLSNANLHGVDLSGADLWQANMHYADLSGANLSGAKLRYANLLDANLREVNLSGADPSKANLGGAILSGARMHEVNLSEANLSEANLSEATLYRANLSYAHLNNANLSDAYLNNANLISANLSGANLIRANLNRTIGITSEQLDKVKSLQGTIMPDGSKHS